MSPKTKKPSASKAATLWKKFWHFIWEEDSAVSWLANIALAFIIIKFIVYPGLGLLLGTSYPVVAVVSGSMEHDENFEGFWKYQHTYYERINISKETFSEFDFKNGFNKGDIIVLGRATDLQVGDVIVFKSSRINPKADPIIHRIVIEKEENGQVFGTKGDHNPGPINDCYSDGCLYESDIREEQVIGKALFRIPYFGWVKIAFVELIQVFSNMFR